MYIEIDTCSVDNHDGGMRTATAWSALLVKLTVTKFPPFFMIPKH